MTPRLPIIFATLSAMALLLMGCPDDGEDQAGAGDGATGDAGVDVAQETPSVESIDFDGAQPAASPQRIHVESSTKRGVISETPHLQISEFLDAEMAAELISGADADLETVQLPGQSPSTSHNSLRYVPRGADHDDFGVGIQVWDLSEASVSLEERLANLRDQFLNVSDADHPDLPQGAFTSRRSGIRSLVFSGQSTPHLFVLSCDASHCRDWDDLLSLGSAIAGEH